MVLQILELFCCLLEVFAGLGSVNAATGGMARGTGNTKLEPRPSHSIDGTPVVGGICVEEGCSRQNMYGSHFCYRHKEESPTGEGWWE
jgi:hypothetical protein